MIGLFLSFFYFILRFLSVKLNHILTFTYYVFTTDTGLLLTLLRKDNSGFVSSESEKKWNQAIRFNSFGCQRKQLEKLKKKPKKNVNFGGVAIAFYHSAGVTLAECHGESDSRIKCHQIRNRSRQDTCRSSSVWYLEAISCQLSLDLIVSMTTLI